MISSTPPFSPAHHVDVEARERPRVVLAERIGERGAALYAAEHVGHDGAQARRGRKLRLDGERAVERQAGLDQSGELLGERDQVAAGHTAPPALGPGEAQPPATVILRVDRDREVGVALQALHDRARVRRLHDPVDRLPPAVGCPIREDGHVSSWVTRKISCTVVSPAHAFAHASSRSVTMPCATASRRISPAGAFRTIRLRASSVMRNSS